MKNTRSNLTLVVLTGLVCWLVFVGPNDVIAQEDSQTITVPINGAKVIETRSAIDKVVTGENEFINVKVASSREIIVFGLKSGATTLHVWTAGGLQQYMLMVSKVSAEKLGDKTLNVLMNQGDTSGDYTMKVFSPEYREVAEFENYIKQLLKDKGEILLTDDQAGKLFVIGEQKILKKIEELTNRLDVPGEEKIYSKRIVLQNRPVTQLEEALNKMLSEEGEVILDRETNSILVVDKVPKVNSIQNYVDKIDVPTVSQVRISARFVEMSDEASRELGIDWRLIEEGDNGQDVVAQFGPGFGGRSGLQLDITDISPDLDATLRALEEKDVLNLISSPNVVTRNQQKAELTIQNQESYVSGCEVQQVEGAQTLVPTIDTLKDGITMNVTPLIGKNNIVQLDVVPELKIATLGSSTNFGTGNCTFFTPETDIRRAKLNVALKDGNTLVIGGLDRREKINNQTGVPLLSDIPLIGNFFSQNLSADNSRNISIFLTAEIVDLKKTVSPEKGTSPDTTAKKVIESDFDLSPGSLTGGSEKNP